MKENNYVKIMKRTAAAARILMAKSDVTSLLYVYWDMELFLKKKKRIKYEIKTSENNLITGRIRRYW